MSACAIDSSVVPVFEQAALKLINSSLFSYSFDIGWSTDTAKNEKPNKVSGLVVKQVILLTSGLPSTLKSISQPKDLPIQFFYMILTLLGHSLSWSRPCSRSSENLDILKNHWLSFFLSTGAPDLQPFPSITCSFARTVSSTGSQLT